MEYEPIKSIGSGHSDMVSLRQTLRQHETKLKAKDKELLISINN